METVGQLLRKGEIDKEVYGLSRLQDDEADRISKAAKPIRTPSPCTST